MSKADTLLIDILNGLASEAGLTLHAFDKDSYWLTGPGVGCVFTKGAAVTFTIGDDKVRITCNSGWPNKLEPIDETIRVDLHHPDGVKRLKAAFSKVKAALNAAD